MRPPPGPSSENRGTSMEKMPPEHYRSLVSLEDHYWWHQSRYAAISEALDRHGGLEPHARIADIGCGTGGFLRFLRRRGSFVLRGFDSSQFALEALREAGLDGSSLDLERPFHLEGGPFDLISALDIMEHVTHEVPFLESVRESLRPQGRIVLTVPGHMFLFSDWDRQLQHHRRYGHKALANALERCGFDVVERTHIFSFVTPLAILRKWFSSYDTLGSCEFPSVSTGANQLLSQLATLERRWLRIGSLALGTSVLGVARRS